MAVKGEWVRIHRVVLKPDERTANIPEDTKRVPYEMWTKGHLLEDAAVGENAKIKTLTGRVAEGVLTEENPSYGHSYGELVPELLEIGPSLRGILFGGDSDE